MKNFLTWKMITSITLRTISATGSILFAFVVVNMFGHEQFGLITTVISAAVFASMVLRYGGDKLCIRHYLESNFRGASELVYGQLVVSTVVCFLSILLFLVLPENFNIIFVYAIPLAFLLVVANNLTSLSVGIGDTHYASVTQIGFLQFVVAVVIYPLSRSLNIDTDVILFIITIALVTLVCVSIGLQLKNVRKAVSSFERSNIQPSVSTERLHIFIASIGGTFQTTTVFVLLSMIITPEELGEFRYLERIAAVISLVTIFQNIILPKYMFPDGSAVINRATIFRINRALLISGILIATILFSGILLILIAIKFTSLDLEFSRYLILLGLAHLVISLVSVINVVFLFARQEKTLMKMNIFVVFLSLILYPLVYQHYSMDGIYGVFAFVALLKSSLLLMSYVGIAHTIVKE